MNRKLLVGTLLAVIVLAIAAAIYFFGFKGRISVPVSKNAPAGKFPATNTNKTPSSELKDFTHASGFSIKHPNDTKVADRQTANAYADLSITSSVPGSTIVKAEDTALTSAEQWIIQNLGSVNSKDVTLGRLPAKEAVKDNRIVTVAVDDAILFLIDTDTKGNKAYWEKVHKTVSESFIFLQYESGVSNVQSETMYDNSSVVEEEVVE